MPFEVESTSSLARAVSVHPDAPNAPPITLVPQLKGTVLRNGTARDVLCAVGWLTAGPPSVTAAALRTAGFWALLRYHWALEDDGRGFVAPTIEARDIRHHTRVAFSEAIGIGVAGWLTTTAIWPRGPLLVADVDDVIDRLIKAGLVQRKSNRKKQPDYLFAVPSPGSIGELMLVECKGTISDRNVSIGQLARGAWQVDAISSSFSMRKLIFATALRLDDRREMTGHAVELLDGGQRTRSGGAGIEADALAELFLDASLIRGLRCAGRYDLADFVRRETDPVAVFRELEYLPTFSVAEREVVGTQFTFEEAGYLIDVAIGIDIEVLRALAEPRKPRLAALTDLLESLVTARHSEGGEIERGVEEILMPDGVAVRLRIHERPEVRRLSH